MEGRNGGEIDLRGETLIGKTKPNKTMETKLNRIAQLSGGNSNMEYRWLMPHYNEEYLTSCFRELEGRKATGVDGVTKEMYGQDLKKEELHPIC